MNMHINEMMNTCTESEEALTTLVPTNLFSYLQRSRESITLLQLTQGLCLLRFKTAKVYKIGLV